jgi:integrase
MDYGKGVELRDKSIRIGFSWNNEWVRETLDWPPTPANAKKAGKLVSDIRLAIKRGDFLYGDFFPDSPKAKKEEGAVKTFGECCDDWLDTKRRLATKSVTQYSNALKVWQEMFGKDTPVTKITHTQVAAKVGSTPWASAKLLNNYLICLRGAFKLAGRDIKINNPMEGIENSKHQTVPPDPLSRQEMESVLTWLKDNADKRVWAYFEFSFMTGMRPEEIIALRWDDMDWFAGTIKVQRARTAGAYSTLKTYQTRDVDLVARAIDAIRYMKEHTAASDYIFQNPVTKKPWHDERSQRDHYWKPALKATGIRYRRAYQCRHTYATNALSAGVNPTYVSRQMGHSNARMLFQVYSKWIDGADRGREKAKMEAMLNG